MQTKHQQCETASNQERFAELRRWCREFVSIEKHPAVYGGVIAVNVILAVGYHATAASVKPDAVRAREIADLQRLIHMPVSNPAIASATASASAPATAEFGKSAETEPENLAWQTSESLHLASLYTLAAVPKIESLKKQSAVMNSGTVSASSLHVSALSTVLPSSLSKTRSSAPTNSLLPPPPPVVTMSAGRPRHNTPSPYLVPPPPPMTPGMEAAQWAGSGNAGLPTPPPYEFASAESASQSLGYSSPFSSSGDNFRSRMRRHARQIIVTR